MAQKSICYSQIHMIFHSFCPISERPELVFFLDILRNKLELLVVWSAQKAIYERRLNRSLYSAKNACVIAKDLAVSRFDTVSLQSEKARDQAESRGHRDAKSGVDAIEIGGAKSAATKENLVKRSTNAFLGSFTSTHKLPYLSWPGKQ